MSPNINAITVVRKLNDPSNPKIEHAINKAKEVAASLNISFHENEDQDTENTLIIAIGGDGTMLYAARRAIKSNALVVGINLGNLGFLTEFPAFVLPTLIHNAIDDTNVFIEERIMLSTTLNNTEHFALNEITLSNNESDKAIQYGLTVIGRQEISVGEHKANCLIISTPTGSTAYSLNVGGSIIEPALNVFQIMPVAAMSMTTRPLIISGDKTINVTLREQEGSTACLKLDGQTISCFDLSAEENITIKRSKKKVRILHAENWNFFSTMTEKLHWNKAFT